MSLILRYSHKKSFCAGWFLTLLRLLEKVIVKDNDDILFIAKIIFFLRSYRVTTYVNRIANSILATETFRDVNIEVELNLQKSEAFNCTNAASGSGCSFKNILTFINSNVNSATTGFSIDLYIAMDFSNINFGI